MPRKRSCIPEIPSELRTRLRNLLPWLGAAAGSSEPWSEDQVALHALERGIHFLECKYWRVRSDDELREDYAWLADEHRHWLRAFPHVHMTRWDQLMETQPESALWEAVARRVLDIFFLRLRPGESVGDGSGPDFLCEAADEVTVAIDAKCLTIETATKRSGLRDHYNCGGSYGQATVSLGRAAARAIRQAQDAADLPFFACLGTLHRLASILCLERVAAEELLAGKTEIRIPLDLRAGRATGDPRLVRSGRWALFPTDAVSEGGEDRDARDTSPLTGILLCDSRAVDREIRQSCTNPCIRGVLNPEASRPVSIDVLHGIPIARIRDGRIEWRDLDADQMGID